MFHNPQYTKLMATVTTTLINPLIQHIQAFKNMIVISNPTYEDVMTIETGSSEVNLWLEWMRYNAQSENMSDCYVCAHGRPHLGTVPLNIPLDKEKSMITPMIPLVKDGRRSIHCFQKTQNQVTP